ncbi:hypothetical protein L2E82_49879 [Cichorium intybus]|uniref:Uncharacterized protein n=1 Tax=Cichorium intybus TaxID=13427 RepID=A0ACB8Z232_CICIN|nr:hypothetical protein L2E82_49879 [Cichorium intybus]
MLAMSANEGNEDEYMLKNIKIDGFSEEQTLFCHDAINDQFVLVTSTSVKLVSLTSRKILQEWHPLLLLHCINVATANATQVLLSTKYQSPSPILSSNR